MATPWDRIQKCGSPPHCFDGTASENGVYDPHSSAKRFPDLHLQLAGLLALADIDSHSVTVVGSLDPNEKVGSAGAGTSKYISAEQALPYIIFFENLSTATAPARRVVINDQLDTTKLDLQTLSLGPILFGSEQVVPVSGVSPIAGVQEFNETVDLRPENNLLVKINARLNITTGMITWTFDSIDPTTGLPPTDPLAGFLPPGGTGSYDRQLNAHQSCSSLTRHAQFR